VISSNDHRTENVYSFQYVTDNYETSKANDNVHKDATEADGNLWEAPSNIIDKVGQLHCFHLALYSDVLSSYSQYYYKSCICNFNFDHFVKAAT